MDYEGLLVLRDSRQANGLACQIERGRLEITLAMGPMQLLRCADVYVQYPRMAFAFVFAVG